MSRPVRTAAILVVSVVTMLRVFAGTSSSGHGKQPAALARGHEVFEQWCGPCHSRGPGNPGTQSLLVKYKGEKPAALEDRKDLTPEITTYFVRRGVSVMPFFRKTEISDADLQALSTYLAHPKTPQ